MEPDSFSICWQFTILSSACNDIYYTHFKCIDVEGLMTVIMTSTVFWEGALCYKPEGRRIESR
jgi:hypothetical protein